MWVSFDVLIPVVWHWDYPVDGDPFSMPSSLATTAWDFTSVTLHGPLVRSMNLLYSFQATSSAEFDANVACWVGLT